MINEYNLKNFCSEDISLIENYDKAIADKEVSWHCHHRLETDLMKTQEELIESGLYFNRPASELILLTPSEHCALHNSIYKKGKIAWNKGKKMVYNDEWHKNLSKAMKGKPKSEEWKQKVRDAWAKKRLSNI